MSTMATEVATCPVVGANGEPVHVVPGSELADHAPSITDSALNSLSQMSPNCDASRLAFDKPWPEQLKDWMVRVNQELAARAARIQRHRERVVGSLEEMVGRQSGSGPEILYGKFPSPSIVAAIRGWRFVAPVEGDAGAIAERGLAGEGPAAPAVERSAAQRSAAEEWPNRSKVNTPEAGASHAAHMYDFQLKAFQGDEKALEKLLAYVLDPPAAFPETAIRASERVWALVTQGNSAAVKTSALQGLEKVLSSSTAHPDALSFIMTRVPRSPAGCFRLVQLGLESGNAQVQRAAVTAAKTLATRAEFAGLWTANTRLLWKSNALWDDALNEIRVLEANAAKGKPLTKPLSLEVLEQMVPKPIAALKKTLMAEGTDPNVQKFIVNLAGERLEGSIPLIAAALEHPNLEVQRRAAQVTLDWAKQEVPQFIELWESKGPQRLKSWFAEELKQHKKNLAKRSKAKPKDLDD